MASTEELTTGFLAGRHTLFAFIYGFVKNPHDAEDIFQEVWVRFSRAVSSGVEIAEPQKWCRGTRAISFCIIGAIGGERNSWGMRSCWTWSNLVSRSRTGTRNIGGYGRKH
jgi:hypothetical protein